MPTASCNAVLIDISGVLAVGGEAVPGAVSALQRLRDAGRSLRFLTNTTRKTRADLVANLTAMGFALSADEVFTAPLAARRVIEQHGWRAHLLVHPDLLPDFEGVPTDDPDVVVVGDAGEAFDYASLNAAFGVLVHQGDRLLSMGSNRYFRDARGELSLDMGPFVKALEFAAGVEATVTGKPSPTFFEAALADMGAEASQAVMIGDDLPNDIGGAQACGIRGVLVRTGKFRPEDEDDSDHHPEGVCDDFPAAVDWLLGPGA